MYLYFRVLRFVDKTFMSPLQVVSQQFVSPFSGVKVSSFDYFTQWFKGTVEPTGEGKVGRGPEVPRPRKKLPFVTSSLLIVLKTFGRSPCPPFS